MENTQKDPREAIIERLHETTSNYGIDFDFARMFAALTGRSETSVLSNIRELTAHYERTGQHISKRKRYELCLRQACQSIWDWFTAGERQEYRTDDVISFVESHCQQCVWAVLLGDFCARRDYPGVFDELNEAVNA